MLHSKLVKVLQSFDRPQVARLKKYLASPYFKTYPPSVALFSYLVRLYPVFDKNKITLGLLGLHHPKLSTPAQNENAGTALMHTIENFIAQEEWQKNEAEQTHWLLKGFKTLRLANEFEKGFNKAMQKLDKNPDPDFETFFERHLLTEFSVTGFAARLNRTTGNTLQPVLKTLDEFYALKKLRYLCEVLNRQHVQGIVFEQEQIPQVLKILKPYTQPKYPYVYLFVNIYHMMAEKAYGHSDMYYRLLKQFIQKQPALTPTLREVADYALNNCLRWSNKGYEEAGTEYLWWIDWKRKNNLLFQQGRLQPVTFRNMVAAAQSRQNTVRILQVIKDYGDYLPEEHRESHLNYASGLLQFSVKNYREAIRFFLMAQTKDEPVFSSIIRCWHWMSLYEYDRNDTDALHNHLHTFEKYLLRNHKELQHRTEVFKLFIDNAFALVKAAGTVSIANFSDALQTQPHFPGKAWLEEKLTEKNKKTVRPGTRLNTSLVRQLAKG